MKENKIEGCFLWSISEMWGVDGAVIEVTDDRIKLIDKSNPKFADLLKELNDGARLCAKNGNKTKYKIFNPSVIYYMEDEGKLFVSSDSPFKEKGFHGGARKGAGRHQKHKNVDYRDTDKIYVPSCIKKNMERLSFWILSVDRESLCKSIDEAIDIIRESERSSSNEIISNLGEIKERLLLLT